MYLFSVFSLFLFIIQDIIILFGLLVGDFSDILFHLLVLFDILVPGGFIDYFFTTIAAAEHKMPVKKNSITMKEVPRFEIFILMVLRDTSMNGRIIDSTSEIL